MRQQIGIGAVIFLALACGAKTGTETLEDGGHLSSLDAGTRAPDAGGTQPGDAGSVVDAGLVDAGTPNGTLDITVTLPLEATDAGLTFSISVSGPSYANAFSALTESLLLQPGSYSVSAPSVVVADDIVGLQYVASVTGSPAQVSSSQTSSVTVEYQARAGSGYLWLPGCQNGSALYNGAVRGYSSAQLHTDGGTLAPEAAVYTLWTDGGCAQAVMFNPQGRLFVTDEYLNRGGTKIWAWDVYADGGASEPSVTIPQWADGGNIDILSGAFQANGDLWAVGRDNYLVQLTAAQLAAAGPQTPSSAIPNVGLGSGNYPSLNQPYGIAFDPQGNLWVGNNGAGVTIAEYTPALDGGYNATPNILLVDAANQVPTLNGLSFDPSGSLWIAAYGNGSVVRVDVAALDAGVQSLVPAAILAGGDTGLTSPDYVTFDAAGSLWVMDQSSGTLRVYPDAGSFSGNVGPAPRWWFNSYVQDVGKIAFDPAAPGTQLFP